MYILKVDINTRVTLIFNQIRTENTPFAEMRLERKIDGAADLWQLADKVDIQNNYTSTSFKTYAAKPSQVEAIQITKNNLRSLDNPSAGVVAFGNFLNVKTAVGVITGNVGDWLIRVAEGEYDLCKDYEFQSKFEVGES